MADTVADAAQAIVQMMQQQFSAPHTIVAADEYDFPHLDLAAYRAFRAEMEARGYQYAGDIEIAELSQSPTTLVARTMIRSMLSPAGGVVAQYYQVRPRIGRRLALLGRGLKNGRWLDAPRNFISGLRVRHCTGFESELTDGTFITTSNAESAGRISGPPTMTQRFFPYGTDAKTLMEAHCQLLDQATRRDPPAAPIPMRSATHLVQMQQRARLQKVAHRQAVQWVTKSELQRMAPHTPGLGDAVFTEVQRLLGAQQPMG
jgi:hypothetical protein